MSITSYFILMRLSFRVLHLLLSLAHKDSLKEFLEAVTAFLLFKLPIAGWRTLDQSNIVSHYRFQQHCLGDERLQAQVQQRCVSIPCRSTAFLLTATFTSSEILTSLQDGLRYRWTSYDVSAGSDDSKDTTPLHSEPSSPDIAIHQEAAEPTAEAPHKSISNDSKITKHNGRTPLQKTSYGHRQACQSSSRTQSCCRPSSATSSERTTPCLDSSQLRCPVSRRGLNGIRSVSLGLSGELPFHISDLAARCQNLRIPRRRLIANGSNTAELSMCEWTDPGDMMSGINCPHSEKHQGMRPRTGPFHESASEKVPLEFFECVGYNMKLAKLPTVSDPQSCVFMNMLDGARSLRTETMTKFRNVLYTLERDEANCTSVLADLNKCHGAGFLICSTCARENYMMYNICLWQHERMLPICRDCCNSPPMMAYKLEIPPGKHTVAENIRNFNRGIEHMECNCYLSLSPEQGHHLCIICRATLIALESSQMRMNKAGIYTKGVPQTIAEAGSPLAHLGRNHCPCGKDRDQLVQSWSGFSQGERDKKMYRMCLLCTGHIPRNKIMTAKPSNCL